MGLDETQQKLLEATMAHVPFDGWSLTALKAGAADAGVAEVLALNAFPGGPADLIEAFSSEMDRRMLVRLEARDLAALRVRERIHAAVRTRLELLVPHREAVRRGMSFLALPIHAPLGTRCLYRTVDAMWHAAGDTSTDYNFYTKRLLLSGVYSSTLLFWLNDRSEGHAETWAFLERRIEDALRLGGTFGKSVASLLDLPDRIMARRRGARPRRRAGSH